MKKMFFAITLLSFSGLCLADATVDTKKKDEVKKTTEVKKETVKKDVSANIAVGNVEDKQLKVCYVDASEIMMTTESGKKVEETRKELAENIGKKQQDLEKKAKDYEAKKTTLSKAAQEKTEDDLIKMKRDYESEVQVSQQKLNIVTQKTLADLEVSTKELAEKGKYDVVYDVYSGRPIYVAKDAMKTGELVALMNKNHEGKKAALKTARA